MQGNVTEGIEGVEICSCDEALALRKALATMTRSRNDYRAIAERLARDLAALRTEIDARAGKRGRA